MGLVWPVYLVECEGKIRFERCVFWKMLRCDERRREDVTGVLIRAAWDTWIGSAVQYSQYLRTDAEQLLPLESSFSREGPLLGLPRTKLAPLARYLADLRTAGSSFKVADSCIHELRECTVSEVFTVGPRSEPIFTSRELMS